MAEQAGHWLALGNPHAGPFTVGSEDTALWSSLGRNAKMTFEGFLGLVVQPRKSNSHTQCTKAVRLTWPPLWLTFPLEGHWEAPQWTDTSHCLQDTQGETRKRFTKQPALNHINMTLVGPMKTSDGTM